MPSTQPSSYCTRPLTSSSWQPQSSHGLTHQTRWSRLQTLSKRMWYTAPSRIHLARVVTPSTGTRAALHEHLLVHLTRGSRSHPRQSSAPDKLSEFPGLSLACWSLERTSSVNACATQTLDVRVT